MQLIRFTWERKRGGVAFNNELQVLGCNSAMKILLGVAGRGLSPDRPVLDNPANFLATLRRIFWRQTEEL